MVCHDTGDTHFAVFPGFYQPKVISFEIANLFNFRQNRRFLMIFRQNRHFDAFFRQNRHLLPIFRRFRQFSSKPGTPPLVLFYVLLGQSLAVNQDMNTNQNSMSKTTMENG